MKIEYSFCGPLLFIPLKALGEEMHSYFIVSEEIRLTWYNSHLKTEQKSSFENLMFLCIIIFSAGKDIRHHELDPFFL